jgi:hypothetical protein
MCGENINSVSIGGRSIKATFPTLQISPNKKLFKHTYLRIIVVQGNLHAFTILDMVRIMCRVKAKV